MPIPPPGPTFRQREVLTRTTTFRRRQVLTPAPPPFNSDEGPQLHHHPSTATRAHTCTSTLKQRRTPAPALSNNDERPYPHLTFNQRRGPTSAPPPSTGDGGPCLYHHLQMAMSAHNPTTTFRKYPHHHHLSTATRAHAHTTTFNGNECPCPHQHPQTTTSPYGCLQQQPLAHTSTLMTAYCKCPFFLEWKWEGHC
jgi:hypothetical protein